MAAVEKPPPTATPATLASPASSPSLASSVTASAAAPGASPDLDLEAAGPRAPTRVSHWKLITDHAGLTPEVLAAVYPGEGTEASPFVVSFLPADPRNPQLFPRWKKWAFTAVMALATLGISFVSTAYTGGLSEIVATFEISTELSILGISLFVLGFAIGPLLWAPSSEFFGRQMLFIITYAALTAFNVGAAVAQNIQTLVIMRFFAGSFGSSPLTNGGGVIADMFSASERGLATAVYAAAPFLGPSLGPIVAGFLGDAAGWRWVEGLMAIFTFVLLVLGTVVVPETYAPVLLRKRAAALTRTTGKLHISKLDMHHRNAATGATGPSMAAQFRTALSRPWILLFREPIVVITSLYMAIIYGTLYMMFAAFPIVFEEGRGWSAGIGGLAFLGLAVGMSVAVAYAMYDNRRYAGIVAASSDGMAPPEARLPTAAIGSVLLPIGLFWFAWTNGPSVHWIVPIIGSGFFAAGIVLVFLSLINYLIDSYVIFAASVLAASTVIRSLFGAAFPLFTTYMYQNLGIHWASSIPAFLSLACLPFPFLFMRYGESIRMRCKFAAEAAEVLKRMRADQQQHVEPAEEFDTDDAIEEADEREAEQKFEHELEKQASRIEGHVPKSDGGHGHGHGVAAASGSGGDSRPVSNDEKGEISEKS